MHKTYFKERIKSINTKNSKNVLTKINNVVESFNNDRCPECGMPLNINDALKYCIDCEQEFDDRVWFGLIDIILDSI